jgi:hypothetical protein
MVMRAFYSTTPNVANRVSTPGFKNVVTGHEPDVLRLCRPVAQGTGEGPTQK